MAVFAAGQKLTATAENTIFQLMFANFMSQGIVGTQGTLTAHTGFTNTLSTGATGPSVTLTSSGSLALVLFACETLVDTAGNTAVCSVAVSGATTISAATNQTTNGILIATRDNNTLGFGQWGLIAINPGTNTFEMQYATGAAGTSTWLQRRIVAWAP